MLLAAAGALLAGVGLGRWAAGKGRPPARAANIVLAGLWVAALAFMFFGEWHGLRYLSPVKTPRDAQSVRVFFWNAQASRTDRFEERLASVAPDVAIVSNAPNNIQWQTVRENLGVTTFSARTARFTIISRYPILRWADTDLNVSGSRPRVAVWKGGGNIGTDTGEGMFVELDTTRMLGRTSLVWVLDLPSDPRIERMQMMYQVAAQLSEFSGRVLARRPDGGDAEEPQGKRGFPAPDLIVGDCNTPRRSASFDHLAKGMAIAFDQAGRGFAATWPRGLPLLPIDQAFVGARLRAAEYHILDMGTAEHRAEVIELVAAK
jgi:endonuclease/exonuclease/phosphatase family metal-dependent hydrolase